MTLLKEIKKDVEETYKNKSVGWRDGSAFQNTGCSCRGPQ